MWLLGFELMTSGRAVSALKLLNSEPFHQPTFIYFMYMSTLSLITDGCEPTMWLLGIELMTSGRADNALNH